MSQKDERYIRIARACLKAINQSGEGSREEQVRRVYEAIDQAFETEVQPYRSRLQALEKLLREVAESETVPENLRNRAREALSDSSSGEGNTVH